MDDETTTPRTESQWLEFNRRFYDSLWADVRLIKPQRFATWPIVQSLLAGAARRIEIAPGLRPRLPMAGTCFVDISRPALASLAGQGGRVLMGSITALPVADRSFDFVGALDIVEHVDDDAKAFSELSRITAPGGALLLATPLHQAKWTPFDDFVGHRRRYDPRELMSRLAEGGFVVEQNAAYGMQPRSSKLMDWGMWHLNHNRKRAMWWYNRVFMPVALRFARRLSMRPGILDMEKVDEVLLVCRKR